MPTWHIGVAYPDPFQMTVLQNNTTSYFTSRIGLFSDSRKIAIRDKQAIAKTIGQDQLAKERKVTIKRRGSWEGWF